MIYWRLRTCLYRCRKNKLVFFCGGIAGGTVTYVDAILVLVLAASTKLLGTAWFLVVSGFTPNVVTAPSGWGGTRRNSDLNI